MKKVKLLSLLSALIFLAGTPMIPELQPDPMLQKGKEYALTVKAELARNLLGAIAQRGTAGAVDFCNIKAIPITDSLSTQLGVHIRRATDQPRNPDNLANQDEMAYINKAKMDLMQGSEIKPQLIRKDSVAVGYYPIITNAMCLQCHGQKGSEIAYETMKVLREKYPDDQAFGYSAEQLRGIWVVEMPLKED
jgi:hypothetical protein